MGCSLCHVSSSSYDNPKTLNPNPRNYKIIKHENFTFKSKNYKNINENYLLIFINYPDAKNYEGNKILLFKNLNINTLIHNGIIDPHFSDKPNISPIARFEPTNKGWEMAIILIKNLIERDKKI